MDDTACVSKINCKLKKKIASYLLLHWSIPSIWFLNYWNDHRFCTSLRQTFLENRLAFRLKCQSLTHSIWKKKKKKKTAMNSINNLIRVIKNSLDIFKYTTRSSGNANFTHFARYIQNRSAFIFDRSAFEHKRIEWWYIQTGHTISQSRQHIIYGFFNAFISMWTVDLTSYCSRSCKTKCKS